MTAPPHLSAWAKLPALLAGLATVLPAAAQTAPAAPQTTTPQAVVDTQESVFGRHAGQRRNHTKGVCAAGEFVPEAGATRFSRSELFTGPAVPVLARFSVAGGRPATPDTARNPRGLGLRFVLPGGNVHQMALLHVPVFGAATPESFHARLEADLPDPATGKPNPARQADVAERYPDNRALGAWLAQHRPPASYAQAAYHSLHAFRFVDAAGQGHWVKWRFVPRDGERDLGDEELKTIGPNFLEPVLQQRLAKGPVLWDLVLTLGEPGDPLDNPTLAWPKERSEVTVGRLTITRAGGTDCDGVNFDPLVLSDGIEPSADPVLLFRSAAYAQSFSRSTVERQGTAGPKR